MFPDVFSYARPKSTNDYWGHVERMKGLIRNYNNEVRIMSSPKAV